MGLFSRFFGPGSKASSPGEEQAEEPHRRKLHKKLSERSRFPSLLPGSFLERDWEFRRKHPVQGRERGFCKLRTSSWGSWEEVYCIIDCHSLKVFPTDGSTAEPGPEAVPSRKLELVGAHLASKGRQELVLSVPGAGSFFFLAHSEEEREEWMVGLGKVPGLFRRVTDYYQLGEQWGRGATCAVQECWGKFDGSRLALKTRVNKTRDATQAMHNELRILQLCAKHPHPAIPHLWDFFFDEDGSIAIVMDLMAGGELFDQVALRQRLTESEAKQVFKDVVEGVAHLHSLGIAHRDLKPQNLMYLEDPDDGGQIKIVDFDLAKVNYAPEWVGDTPCGTVHYMAPEVVRHQKYSQAVDMWSLGVILYILLSGRMPFDGTDRVAVEAAIDKGEYWMGSPATPDANRAQAQPSIWDRISLVAKDLLRRLLCHDPAQRITAAECLRHPWFAQAPGAPPLQLPAAGAADAAATSAQGAAGAVAGGGERAAPQQQEQLGEEGAELVLPTPELLRSHLGLSAGGRRMLALAAQAQADRAHSAGSKSRGSSPSGGSPRSPQLAGTRSGSSSPRPSPLRNLLDFDMRPLREQEGSAGAPAADRGGDLLPGVSSRQRLASLLPTTEEEEEEERPGATYENGAGTGDSGKSAAGEFGAPMHRPSGQHQGTNSAMGSPKLDLLRSQLEVIGTAGGLRDRRVMSAKGEALYPTSPKGAAGRAGGALAARPFDDFADIEAEHVIEEPLAHDKEEAREDEIEGQ